MKNFFKVSQATWPQIEIKMNRDCPKALDLWWHLVPLSNKLGFTAGAGVTQKGMEKMLHVKSRTTVHKAVKYLADHNCLKICKYGTQNVYILNPDLVSKTPKDTTKDILKNYGITFSANFLITASDESDKDFYKDFANFVRARHTGKININKLTSHGIHHDGSRHNNQYSRKSEAKANRVYKRVAKRSASSKGTKKSQRSKGKQAD